MPESRVCDIEANGCTETRFLTRMTMAINTLLLSNAVELPTPVLIILITLTS